MSRYTIELRNVINIYGEDTVKEWFKDYDMSEYLTPAQIATITSAGLWTKDKLATKLMNHFYMREIGLETPALFRLKLKVRLQEIMEAYLPMIYSVAIEYDPLVNVDYTETYAGSNSSSGTGLNVDSDTPQGQISKTDILAGKYASATSANSAESNGSDSYVKKIKGNSGVSATAQKMVQQYRENIVRLNEDIAKELEPLFMGIY